jgi:hypothetical protein
MTLYLITSDEVQEFSRSQFVTLNRGRGSDVNLHQTQAGFPVVVAIEGRK